MRKDIGLVGIVVLSGLLLGFAPWALAAEYSVRFGELQGADHETVVPTTNIKLCYKSTGYGWGYEIIPPSSASYEYYTLMHLPAPPASVEGNTQAISEGGKEIKWATKRVSGPHVQNYSFDTGDPIGAWALDVVVQNAVVATIKFDVVPASSCP